MTALAQGSSITLALQDGGQISISTNGGLASVIATPTGGVAQSQNLGPLPVRVTVGPFSEGASVTIYNQNAVLDYDRPGGNVATITTDPLTGGMALVGPDGESIAIPATLFRSLKKWRVALANTMSGLSDSKSVFIGDSTDCGYYASGSQYAGNRKLTVPQAFAKRLAGIGVPVSTASQFGTQSVPTGSLAAYDPQWTYGAGWSGSSVGSVAGGFLLQNTSDTTTANYTPTDVNGTALVFDRIEICYLKNSTYANFTVAVDGGAALFTSTQAGAGAFDTQTINVTSGTHTINIAKTAPDAAKTFYLASIRAYSSTAKTVQVMNLAGGSMDSTKMANSAQYFGTVNMLTRVAPHLTTINCSINDALAATSIATYKANIQAIITAAKISGDVILRTGNTGSPGYSGFVLDSDDKYIAALEELAVLNGCPFINIKSRLGQFAEMSALGFIVDGLHPTQAGYYDIANPLFELAKPQ